MKHIKKNFKKISNASIKKGITTCVLLFFAMVMLFQKDTPNTEFQFVRNGDEGSIHGVANDNAPASQRDYLFQNEAGNDVYQGQMTDWQRRNEVTPPSTEENIDGVISTSGNTQMTGTIGSQTGKLYTWDLGTWIIFYSWSLHSWTIETGTETIDIISTTETIPWGLDCITPWKEIVKNKDFTLAYEQRKDVNNICNIEKRRCDNGVLWWSFTQKSCKEDIVYTYRKVEVISYNQKILNEYIQPVSPINAWAEFSNEGKIDTTENPTTTRGTTNASVVTNSWTTQSTLPNKAKCITPRGQKINHGQFIKAYKAPRWFIDLACDVEIRACVNGNLKGRFTYSKCSFNNTSYAEYIKAGSPESSEWFLFFQRIRSAIRR